MVNEGELVLLYGGRRARYLLQYKPGLNFSSHLGEITLPEHLEYGTVVESHKGYKFVVLRPSLSDMILHIKRQTTVMYPKDIGYLILETGLKEGSIVAEVGSGSGGLTTALASIVGERGKVHSFERREEFQKLAMENVKKYGLLSRVNFYLKDVSIEGFGLENLETIFVDVPEPWTVVKWAREALAGGGFWASLSPNIEQVQKTVSELKAENFVMIKTVEILEREIMVRDVGTRPKETMISHTGYLTVARKVNPLQ
ncbi:MAG TPA: tRNA (adenine-N1)-methyltransferase [Candidatus Hydrothermia bacterium]|nr:tRNA (adenine-N1)-methyltransferase [Candidatus Hydrothermia bacterium]HOP31789.1 tRNA (adenine-N1)-methyltransferase [Candidatus Hydrothermia bacterium]